MELTAILLVRIHLHWPMVRSTTSASLPLIMLAMLAQVVTSDGVMIDATAPSNMRLSNLTVPENSGPNSIVGTLTATDPPVGGTLTYSLPPGLGDNAKFTIEGTTLRFNTHLDFEEKSSYTVTVRVTDSAKNTLDQKFTVSVININEAPAVYVQGYVPVINPVPIFKGFRNTPLAFQSKTGRAVQVWDNDAGAKFALSSFRFGRHGKVPTRSSHGPV